MGFCPTPPFSLFAPPPLVVEKNVLKKSSQEVLLCLPLPGKHRLENKKSSQGVYFILCAVLYCYLNVSNTSAVSSIDSRVDTHRCELRDTAAARFYRCLTF